MANLISNADHFKKIFVKVFNPENLLGEVVQFWNKGESMKLRKVSDLH